MYNLRPHQEVFVNSVLTKLETNNKILGQAACGFGKTLCMAFFTTKSKYNTLILVNSIDLLNQTKETYDRQQVELGTFISKDKTFPKQQNVVAMVETVKNRIRKNPNLLNNFDLIIVDECHVLVYEEIINRFQNKKIIGLTGTPVRLKRIKIDNQFSELETMSDIFEDIVVSESVNWLIENGYLCKEENEYIDFNYSKLKTDSSGEFTASSLKVVFESEDYINAMLHTFKKLCAGKKVILYTSATSTNKLYCDKLTAIGFNCRTYDSKNNVPSNRKEIVEWFEKEEGDSVLINTGCFTTGFSHDNVEVIFVARATKSLSLWIQMIGRGARNSKDIEKPYFTLIDGGNNNQEHGIFSFDRDWKKIFSDKQRKSFLLDIVECDVCEYNFEKKEKICLKCGWEIPTGEQKEQEQKEFVIVGQKNKLLPPTLDLEFHINKGHSKYETLKILKQKWITFLTKLQLPKNEFLWHEKKGNFATRFIKYLRPLYFKIIGSMLKDGKSVKWITYTDKILTETKNKIYE